ncbi:Histone-lysine N-methyltransferase, H3 lysine-36 specific [Frankliniella fusca]|uniref:Histone-lysine N-methyltransferase, H3 lysine-36 specific n=1 Tax=Frankliniella fusca TaxID=407009 RepID=A0AAE1H9S7_9NEOP|nr:Histone-lysine N-methyltransferase, H3 lysine-36 specific [Frankliniella fusca]
MCVKPARQVLLLIDRFVTRNQISISLNEVTIEQITGGEERDGKVRLVVLQLESMLMRFTPHYERTP